MQGRDPGFSRSMLPGAIHLRDIPLISGFLVLLELLHPGEAQAQEAGATPNVAPIDASGTGLNDALAEGLGSILPFQTFDDIIAGRVRTHVDLPEVHPAAYAMRHEFLDALTAECGLPDRFDDLARRRELMDQVMFSYALYDVGRIGDLSEATFPEALARFLANPVGKMAPSHLIRLAIAEDPESAARLVASGLGGCDSPQVARLKENLDAIAVMGPLISPDATLLKAEVNAAAGQVNCFYANSDRPDYESFQPYELATLANVALYIPPFGTRRGPDEFFLRGECPATPDPAFGLMEVFIHPEPDLAALPQGDRAERIATAFLDQYIPAYVQGPDGSPVVLDPDLRARYFDEIVRFERIDVPPEEVSSRPGGADGGGGDRQRATPTA